MSIFNRNHNNIAWSNQGESRPLVIITGYYGFDNLGDEAILEELLIELNTICPKQNIVVLSNNPVKTASLYQINSFNRWHWPTYIYLLTKAKLLISGGGGLFQDRTGLGSVIFYGLQILLARLFGVRTFIYGQGLGPLNSTFSRKLTQLALKQASYITLRDDLSISMAQEWGLPCRLTADPVWALPASPLPASIKKLIGALRSASSGVSKNKALIVGLSLRDDPALKEYHLELLARIIASILPVDSNILLLPLQPNSDCPLLRQIEKYLLKSNLSVTLINASEMVMPSQWLALIENLDFVIGMRFHALLMALKTGKAVIGLAYDSKVSLLLDQFKQPSLLLEPDRQSCEVIWSKTINNAVINQKEFTSLVSSKLPSVKQLASGNIDALTEALGTATTGNTK